MSRQDPLASPTLAQLYISQGHEVRAAGVLDAVLEADPFNGHALALRERLGQRNRALLSLSRTDGRLRARFRHREVEPARVHVVLEAWTIVGGRAVAEPMSSRPCPRPEGELLLPGPSGPASVCACLAALDAGGVLRVLAVAEPLVW